MVYMCVLVYSCFRNNPSTRSWLTAHLSKWGCYRGVSGGGSRQGGRVGGGEGGSSSSGAEQSGVRHRWLLQINGRTWRAERETGGGGVTPGP
jgi:hypothetical protein